MVRLLTCDERFASQADGERHACGVGAATGGVAEGGGEFDPKAGEVALGVVRVMGKMGVRVGGLLQTVVQGSRKLVAWNLQSKSSIVAPTLRTAQMYAGSPARRRRRRR